MIALVVGLGNPGGEYERTRHNVGFMVADRLCQRVSSPWRLEKKFQGWAAEGILAGQRLRILKPNTYMNASGMAVRSLCDWYRVPPDQTLVLYDDLDLPFGRLRLRLSGSAGGHNGMKSIISHLGTQNFPRLRVGIGRGTFLRSTGDGRDAVVGHVLGGFAPEEQKLLSEVLDLAEEMVLGAIAQGIEKTMSLYNNREVNPRT
ncbi:MAG: aminoacyl-tRNA hydrolase [Oscillatoriales cyanobacterium SM2_2_1]|nr:aminoacyl-tRNA hydrolase [Oscillatoriales cyanobacterium SM2_2_1]